MKYKRLSLARRNIINGIVNIDKGFRDVFNSVSKIKNKHTKILIRNCLIEAQFQLDDAVAWAEYRNQNK